jgi:BirA family biotin operon repressor/biotin-[acetyl-CoA-carboxylase] ligase
LIDGRKLAGILCEASSLGFSNTRVVVGIGLNRCADLSQAGLDSALASRAASLHQISNIVPGELELLERLRYHLLQVSNILAQTETPGIVPFLPQLRDCDFLRDRSVRLELAGKQFAGQAVGIDAWGRLLLRLASGEMKAFISGRVVWWEVGNRE